MSTAAEMSGCQKLVNWILCCKDDELSDLNQKGTNGVDTSAMELPGYLNRFNYDGAESKQSGKSWSGSDDDGVSATDSLKKFKGKGKLDGNSVASSDIIHSECDSGLGSASDSGRGRSRTGINLSNSDNSEKEGSSDERPIEEIENIKRLQSLVRKSDVVIAQPITTYEKSKPKKHDSSSDESNKPEKSRRKPKRNESTLSRFSSIFGSNGRNLTDVLVEEFRLNDRFSGLSMDRIWGGFMDGIKEETESGEPEIPETPETKAKRALNEKTKKRRRRRARNQAPQMATKTTKPIQAKSFKRQKSRKAWQQELPQDWQDVIAL